MRQCVFDSESRLMPSTEALYYGGKMYVGPSMIATAETVHVILDKNGDYTYRTIYIQLFM